MGWTAGHLQGAFTARAAIEFDLGPEFAARVIDTARYGQAIYAAVRAEDGDGIFGLVLMAERRDGLLYTKPISEDMGPAQDGCPARILDRLTEPSNRHAQEWRERCRARLAKPRPDQGRSGSGSSEVKGPTSPDATFLRAAQVGPTASADRWHRSASVPVQPSRTSLSGAVCSAMHAAARSARIG